MTTTAIHTAIPLPYDEIRSFCERHHIVRLWLFGSVLHGNFNADSDVDVLVEFDPEHVPGLEFYTWQVELEAIFRRPVDLTTPNALSKYIKRRVMDTAEIIYERAG